MKAFAPGRGQVPLFFRRAMDKSVAGASTLLESRNKQSRKKAVFTAVLFVLMLFAGVACLTAGSSGLKFSEVIGALFNRGEASAVLIVRSVRLPRVIAAAAAGAGLALSGCIMQNVLGNPIASPSTLGVSSAAVFGANAAIVLLGAGVYKVSQGVSFTIENPYTVTVCAFACALSAVGFILLLSLRRGFSPDTVVLSGVAAGAFFTAGTTLIQYFSAESGVSAAVFWSFGDLGRASSREACAVLFVSAAAFVWFFVKRRDFNALAAGEETAKSLGVATVRLSVISLAVASLVCAVCVSFLGIIGFVGLVAPQAVKRFIGSDYRFLIPASALAGAVLLLTADTLCRSVLVGTALPVGAVTSLFGAPVFLVLLLKKPGKTAPFTKGVREK